MPKRIVKSSESHDEQRFGKHRFEHWRVDRQVYFLTARCTDRFPAFADNEAKDIFWDRFEHYSQTPGFVPWVTSLLDNHYHTIGYLREGKELPMMMQRIHGSVAKLVNDRLRAQGVQAPWLYELPKAEGGSPPGSDPVPDHNADQKYPKQTTGGEPPSAKRKKIKFFGDVKGREYFDGCLRDEKQGRLTYRYVLTQCRRHGVCMDPVDYPHTRVGVELERAIRRANELDAFLRDVPYSRYQRRHRGP